MSEPSLEHTATKATMKPNDHFQLDHASPIPLYRQLRSSIQQSLASGEWPNDKALPSERELSETLNISRATVRQAIQELELEGWLVRRQGRGTYPSPAKVEQPLARITSFTENMRHAGITPTSTLISTSLEPATGSVARALSLGPSGVVAVITRLRLANGQAIMLEKAHINYTLVPGILERDLTGSLYELLHDTYRLQFAQGQEKLEAILPELWLSKALTLPRNTPVLYTERTVSTIDGIPLEYTQRYGRADKCSFRVNLEGDNANFTFKELAFGG
jgi:GntR family transcriptional regulator